MRRVTRCVDPGSTWRHREAGARPKGPARRGVVWDRGSSSRVFEGLVVQHHVGLVVALPRTASVQGSSASQSTGRGAIRHLLAGPRQSGGRAKPAGTAAGAGLLSANPTPMAAARGRRHDHDFATKTVRAGPRTRVQVHRRRARIAGRGDCPRLHHVTIVFYPFLEFNVDVVQKRATLFAHLEADRVGARHVEIRQQLPRGRLISHPESGWFAAVAKPAASFRRHTMDANVSSPPPSGSRIVTDEHRAHVLRAMNRSRWRMDGFWEWSKIVIFAVALFVVIRTFGVEAYKIPSGSMENTLLVGDFLLVNKALYGAEVPFTNVRLPALRCPAARRRDRLPVPARPAKNYVKRLDRPPGRHRGDARWRALARTGGRSSERYVVHSQPAGTRRTRNSGGSDPYLVRTAEASVGYHPSRNNWGPLIVPAEELLRARRQPRQLARQPLLGLRGGLSGQGTALSCLLQLRSRTRRTSFAWLTDIRWSRLGDADSLIDFVGLVRSVRPRACAASRWPSQEPLPVWPYPPHKKSSYDEGSLDQYLRDISAYPLITRDEEVAPRAAHPRRATRKRSTSSCGRTSASSSPSRRSIRTRACRSPT